MDKDKYDEKAEELLLNELTAQMNHGIPVKEEEIPDFNMKDPGKFEEVLEKVSNMYQAWFRVELKGDIRQALSALTPGDNFGVAEIAGVCPNLMGYPMMHKEDYPSCKAVHCYECWMYAVAN